MKNQIAKQASTPVLELTIDFKSIHFYLLLNSFFELIYSKEPIAFHNIKTQQCKYVFALLSFLIL